MDNGHRTYLNYVFRKSERPVLTKQAMGYLIKSGKVQVSLSSIKPGITIQRYHIMYPGIIFKTRPRATKKPGLFKLKLRTFKLYISYCALLIPQFVWVGPKQIFFRLGEYSHSTDIVVEAGLCGQWPSSSPKLCFS